MPFGFLVETYATERLKTLSVWSQFRDAELEFRPEPRTRSVREQMVHQCLSEHGWFTTMLGLPVMLAPLPDPETRLGFLERYAESSGQRLALLHAQPDPWFDELTLFFGEERSRAWVLVRRIAHSAHHRGQLSTYHRLLGHPLYSTYGPTADTGGLPADGAAVIYRYVSVDALLSGERAGGTPVRLRGPGAGAPTERPPVPSSRRPA
jgi:uncharacterized damage-inducible protein DinB